MATIVELDGVAPTIGEGVFLAPTAVLVGDVRVGDRANIWFGTVLRGDISHIEIGPGCSIQDTAVIHCAEDLPTVIGADVVVGHGAMAAAGAVVPERQTIPPGVLAAGVPAKTKKELSGSALAWTGRAAAHYQLLRERYLRGAIMAPGMDARRLAGSSAAPGGVALGPMDAERSEAQLKPRGEP